MLLNEMCFFSFYAYETEEENETGMTSTVHWMCFARTHSGCLIMLSVVKIT